MADGEFQSNFLSTPDVALNPDMVVLARESRGYTQSEMAELLGVSQGWLSRVESGLRTVSETALNNLSRVTEYPCEFFIQPDRVYGIDLSTLFHRKRQDVPLKVLNRIHAEINVRRIQIARMVRGVDMLEPRFRSFDLDEYGGIVEDVARAVRAYWQLPHGPIRNVVKLIEDAGGIVVPMTFGTPRIDAICLWPNDTPPLFFINAHAPTDRLRFTLCHELGHIFMHQGSPNPEMEKQSDRFAAQLLMPDREIRPFLVQCNFTLGQLGELKVYWKVSVAALVKRARDLEVLSDRQERYIWTSKLAPYKTREPVEFDLPPEQPTLLQEIVDTYRTDLGYNAAELSRLIHLKEREAQDLYFPDRKHLRSVR